MQGPKAVFVCFFHMVGWEPLLGHGISVICYYQHFKNNIIEYKISEYGDLI